MKMYKKITNISIIFIMSVLFLIGCGSKNEVAEQLENEGATNAETEISSVSEQSDEESNDENVSDSENRHIVAIDAGHQLHGNNHQEPIGPGASQTKAKVASGTRGTTTGIPEYKLTLAVALDLRDILEQRGYSVVMTREDDDVDISNAERAEIANEAEADVFIRIHADGVDDSSVNGMTALCQTPGNPYNGELYPNSRSLCENLLNSMNAITGAKIRGVSEVDNMSGINWAKVPVCIIEMGFMTNPSEDTKMSTKEYRYLLAKGMADGIDNYFNEN